MALLLRVHPQQQCSEPLPTPSLTQAAKETAELGWEQQAFLHIWLCTKLCERWQPDFVQILAERINGSCANAAYPAWMHLAFFYTLFWNFENKSEVEAVLFRVTLLETGGDGELHMFTADSNLIEGSWTPNHWAYCEVPWQMITWRMCVHRTKDITCHWAVLIFQLSRPGLRYSAPREV